MPRHSNDFVLIKRKLRSGKTVFYYRLAGESVHHSTGESLEYRARDFVKKRIAERAAEAAKPAGGRTVREFLEPYFTESCPHTARLRSEHKSIGDSYVNDQRTMMSRHLFDDATLMGIPLDELRRGDIIDFRHRLEKKPKKAKGAGLLGARTVNRVISILKVCFEEGLLREELESNPARAVPLVNDPDRREKGVLTPEEMQAMFANAPGPFDDFVTWCVFLVAARCGLRRGEILVLQWRQVDFDGGTILVDRALKSRSGTEIGPPKWGRKRSVPLPGSVADALKKLRREGGTVFPHPDSLVFAYEDGSMRGGSWWTGAFRRSMTKMKIDTKLRNISAHSLRHGAATRLVESGLDRALVRAILGHASEAVAATYTHYQAMQLEEAAKAMDRIGAVDAEAT